MIFSLAHCALCDCWLTPCESCLHIQAIDDAAHDGANRHRFGAPVRPFHTAEINRV